MKFANVFVTHFLKVAIFQLLKKYKNPDENHCSKQKTIQNNLSPQTGY